MDLFEYIAVLTSIIIGLGMAHLLRGVASLIQQSLKPDNVSVYWVHLCWVGYMFFTLVFWWWWEFRLGTIEVWTFGVYFFVVFYAFVMFLLCALLFPITSEGCKDYKEYFYSIRFWLFGLLGISYVLDLVDTLAKGQEYFMNMGAEYLLATLAQILFSMVAMVTRNEHYHALFAIGMLTYQVSWAMRLFSTVG